MATRIMTKLHSTQGVTLLFFFFFFWWVSEFLSAAAYNVCSIKCNYKWEIYKMYNILRKIKNKIVLFQYKRNKTLDVLL